MSVITPNMSLIESTVAVDTGLSWEQNLNASLELIDGHDHTPGKGVQIPPSGLNINTDLNFFSNNAINLRSVRFTPLGSPITPVSPDVGALYEAGVDLYYNDGAGNQIRITQSGAIAGTPGSITGLVAPASVTYVPIGTVFIFQSNVNTAANLDAGAITLRNITASSHGITIAPTASLQADYTISLPLNAPATNSVVATAASGASIWQATFHAVVGSSAEVAAGRAHYTSLGAAITASSSNWRILILPGSFTENVTITSTTLNIFGSGRSSIITGNLSFAGATYCVLQGIQFIGNMTIDSSSNGNQITNCYIGAANTVTDSGNGSYIELIQG